MHSPFDWGYAVLSHHVALPTRRLSLLLAAVRWRGWLDLCKAISPRDPPWKTPLPPPKNNNTGHLKNRNQKQQAATLTSIHLHNTFLSSLGQVSKFFLGGVGAPSRQVSDEATKLQKCWRGVLAKRRVQERAKKEVLCLPGAPWWANLRSPKNENTHTHTHIYIYIDYIDTWYPKQQFFIGCFNWMIPNLYMEKVVSPNIHFKLVVWGSRHIYLYKCTIICKLFMKDGWMIFDSFLAGAASEFFIILFVFLFRFRFRIEVI